MKRLALLLLALVLLAPAAGAVEVWEKQLGEKITAVATDERGDLIFVGTEDGMLYAYTANGDVVLSKQLPTTIQQIETDSEGRGIILRRPGRVDYYDRDGSRVYTRGTGSYLPWSVDITRDGSAFIYLTNRDLGIYLSDGSAVIPFPAHPIGTPTAASAAIAGDGSWFVYGATASGTTTLYHYILSLPNDHWYREDSKYSRYRVHGTISDINSPLSGYPIQIKVVRASGTSTGDTVYAPECRSDFADIRFTASDGVTELPHYLASISGNTATFYVQTTESDIYIYWGNLATSHSDPAVGTYLYDEFLGSSLDPARWTGFGGASRTVADGKLTISGNNVGFSGVRSTLLFSGGNVRITTTSIGTDLGGQGSYWIGFFGVGQIPVSTGATDDPATLKRAGARELDGSNYASTADGTTAQKSKLSSGWGGTKPWGIDWQGTQATISCGSSSATLSNAPTSNCDIMLAIGDTSSAYGPVTMVIDKVELFAPLPDLVSYSASWGPVESTAPLQDTKTLDGTIVDIDAPETGDWVAVSTTTKTYIIEITDSGFGTVYSADRTGTPYDVAIANNGANTIEGRGILADIFRFDGAQVGTYTAGGPVRTVAVAQKNGLYAAAGSDDGKYYIFSKDESSSWYLLHASDSEDPVTAIAMSWRGEIAIIGRADGRLTAFQVSEQDATGTVKLNVFKANKPYAAAPLRIEDGGTNQEWSAPITVTTDDYGVAVVPVQWGHYLRITVGDDELSRVLVATPSQAEYVIYIPTDLPLRAGANYRSWYDSVSSRLYYSYFDTRGKTHVATFEIIRNSDNEVVHTETFTLMSGDTSTHTGYYQIPAGFTNTSYRVHLTASGSPSFSNTWHQWISGESGVASLPVELSDTLKIGVFMVLLLFIGGIFSYFSGPHGAVVVSLVAAMLVFWGWLPISPAVVVLCVVWAFLGLLGRTSVG